MRARLPVGWALLCGVAFLTTAVADEPKAAAKRQPVGTYVSEPGALASREKFGQPWHVLAKNEAVYSGDLLVGAIGAVIDSQNKAVRIDYLGDMGGKSPYPIHETAVILHENPDVDLDVTMDRGRVDFTSLKAKGAAHVRVHVRQDVFDLSLQEPGSSMALEMYGRWPRGAAFTTEPGPKDVPTASVIFLVLHGEVLMKHDIHERLLTAPPGPALIEWDSVTGLDSTPQTLKELPPWAKQTINDNDPLVQRKKATIARFRNILVGLGVDAALEAMINSDDEYDRRLAVIAMAAFDDLPRLGKALRETKHPDVWDNGVLAFRHWIGRAPGQDMLLYKGLIENGKATPVEARTILELLHSFGDEDLAQPETYQMLITFLDHDKLALRGLAYWHLSRLVPAGKKLGYNAFDAKDVREAAVKKWRELIPKGKIPPKPQPGDGK
jgi:hypothetical protein